MTNIKIHYFMSCIFFKNHNSNVRRQREKSSVIYKHQIEYKYVMRCSKLTINLKVKSFR